MKKITLMLLLLSAKSTFAQIINGGFEVWDTTYTSTYSAELSSNFGVPNPLGGVVNHWVSGSVFGVSQTTDSYSGNYSLILHNWYSYVQEWITYREAISSTPRYLQGYFKYITGGADGLSHATATVTATRFNGISNDTIATGTYQFDSTATFTPFQLNISLTSQIPDSITIYIINSNSQCALSNVCNLLYLDNLTFTDTPLGIQPLPSTEDRVTVYPNPFTNKITIETNEGDMISIYSLTGEKIKSSSLKKSQFEFDTAELNSGIYLINILKEGVSIETKRIVKN